MKTWKPLIILSLLGILLNPKLANAVNVDGFFINSPACSVKVYRKPTGPIDTLRTITNIDGKWGIETANFNPPAGLNEILYVHGGWNFGKKAKTFWIRGPPGENFVYDLNLNKHTACIKDVHDSTHFNSAPLKLIYWINGFPPCTTEVDTGYNQGFTFYYDIHAPFDTSQAQHGAQAHFRLEKVRGDTTFYRNIDFLIDTTRFDAQLVKDTIYFTRDSSVIGIVEENNLENLIRKDGGLVKGPSIVRGGSDIVLNTEGDYYLYDVSGKIAYKGKGNKINTYDLSNGAYFLFLKPKDSKELLKPEKVIVLE